MRALHRWCAADAVGVAQPTQLMLHGEVSPVKPGPTGASCIVPRIEAAASHLQAQSRCANMRTTLTRVGEFAAHNRR